MSREEIDKLLGGYATDTLSAEERRALFAAALDDQELFDALAKEQALREVLDDPPARQQLIEALGPEHEAFGARMGRWFRQPLGLALAGGVAALLIVSGIALRESMRQAHQEAILADAMERGASRAPTPQTVPQSEWSRRAMAAPKSLALKSESAVKASKPAEVVALPPAPALESSNSIAAAAPPPIAAPLPIIPGAAGALTGGVVAPMRLAPGGGGGGSNTPQDRMIDARPMATGSLKKFKAQAAAPPDLTYSLLVKSADSAEAAALPGAVFHAGDAVRIQVEPNDSGRLYLFQKDASGESKLTSNLAVEKGHIYVLPDDGLQSAAPAKIELMLVFQRSASRVPHTITIPLEFH